PQNAHQQHGKRSHALCPSSQPKFPATRFVFGLVHVAIVADAKRGPTAVKSASVSFRSHYGHLSVLRSESRLVQRSTRRMYSEGEQRNRSSEDVHVRCHHTVQAVQRNQTASGQDNC